MIARALGALLLLASTAHAEDLRIAFIADSFSSERAPALATIRAMDPTGVFLIGDFPHDNPGTNCASHAACLAKMRAMYARLYGGVTPLGADYKRQILDGGVPVLGRINDDHDSVRNDVSNNFKFWPAVIQAFGEAHPNIPPDNGLELGYMFQRMNLPMDGGLATFILLDVRSHRETTGALKKTILGTEQRLWLAAQLRACADPAIVWCVIISPVPVNPNQDKLDSWHGYPAERAWLEAQVAGRRNVLVVSADLHWGSIALPPDVAIPELNVQQLNKGFSNTGDNADGQWTLNSTKAGTGFGWLQLGQTEATLAILNADGSTRLSARVTRE